jgi:hypothetical protein
MSARLGSTRASPRAPRQSIDVDVDVDVDVEADSSKHYKIARGEAMVCAASLDVMKLRRMVAPERYERGLRLLEAVVAMLTKML